MKPAKLPVSKKASAASKAVNDDNASNEGLCCVCFRKVVIYSIGECNHPVCYNCCTRMRVLCATTECAICRKDMASVIFTTNSQLYASMNQKNMTLDRRFSIYFESEVVMNAYDILLEHVCKQCPTVNKFSKFCDLEKHMIEDHSKYYCHLCVQNLKCFTHERKFYTLDLLRVHRSKGDADDKSHRGHPLCEFCNERFLDRDTLHLHLRRNHYHCHFCNADGGQEFYDDYNDLRNHFRKDHCLCEEGDCVNERFTTVFRTKLDLQAHWSLTHAHTVSRHEARQGRTIETEFRMFWSNNERGRGGRQNGPGRMRQTTRSDQDLADQEIAAAAFPPSDDSPQKPVNIRSAQDFPTLGGAAQPMADDSSPNFLSKSMSQRFAEQNRFSVRSGNRNLTQEDFPLLGTGVAGTGSDSVPVAAAYLKMGANRKPNVSIQYKQQRPAGAANENRRPQIANVSHSNNIRMAGAGIGRPPKMSAEDYPALGGEACAYESPTWVKPKSGVANGSLPKKTAPRGVEKARPTKPNFEGLNDFPSLGGSTGDLQRVLNYTGKSSVAVPMKKATTSAPAKAHHPPAESNVNTKQRNNNGVRPKKKINLSNIFEDPDVDLSMTRLGDYESVSATRTSNIRLVRQEDLVKKTELKIGELSAPKFKKGDFPSLGGAAAAPDINSNWRSAPNAKGGKSAAPKDSGIKFTSSLGSAQFDDSDDTPTYSFLLPPNFDDRNRALISTINARCHGDANKFTRFKNVAAQLRDEQLNYMEYYNQCKQIMGKANFLEVFPELLALLPDITAQQGILEQYRRTDGTRATIKFAICSTCQQVLLPEDFSAHAQTHVFGQPIGRSRRK